MGKRLRRMGIATCGLLLAGSVLTACTVSIPAGLFGALLSLAAFVALIVGLGVGTAGCEEDSASTPPIGPCLSTLGDLGRCLTVDATTQDPGVSACLSDAGVGPCLQPPTDLGPCLSRIFDEGTCLQPPPDVGVCLGPLPPDAEELGDEAMTPCLSMLPPDAGPCLSVEPPDAEELKDEAMTPCLSIEPPDTGPCLSVEPPDAGPCLLPPLDFGPCLDMVPDADDSDADGEDSDAEEEEDVMGPCLSPPYYPPDEGASRAPAADEVPAEQVAAAGWSRSFERLVERGALPPDVAERLKKRPPRRS